MDKIELSEILRAIKENTEVLKRIETLMGAGDQKPVPVKRTPKKRKTMKERRAEIKKNFTMHNMKERASKNNKARG